MGTHSRLHFWEWEESGRRIKLKAINSVWLLSSCQFREIVNWCQLLRYHLSCFKTEIEFTSNTFCSARLVWAFRFLHAFLCLFKFKLPLWNIPSKRELAPSSCTSSHRLFSYFFQQERTIEQLRCLSILTAFAIPHHHLKQGYQQVSDWHYFPICSISRNKRKNHPRPQEWPEAPIDSVYPFWQELRADA